MEPRLGDSCPAVFVHGNHPRPPPFPPPPERDDCLIEEPKPLGKTDPPVGSTEGKKPTEINEPPPQVHPIDGIYDVSELFGKTTEKSDRIIRDSLHRRKTFRKLSSITKKHHPEKTEKESQEMRISKEEAEETEEDEEDVYEDAQSIFDILEKSLRMEAPRPDTLKLPIGWRRKLCHLLYLDSPVDGLKGWEALADEIGWNHQESEMVKAFTAFHSRTTAGEIVLRHWQYRFNKYGVTRPKCPYTCTLNGLLEVLRKIGRLNIVEEMEKYSK